MKDKRKELKSKDYALLSASIANEKKATDVIVLNVGGLSSVTDYIMICSGSSDRQVRAITDSLVKSLKKLGNKPLNVEGYNEGKWVLLDFNDLVIHVFYEPIREFYRLEELWHEVEKVDISKDYPDKFKEIEK